MERFRRSDLRSFVSMWLRHVLNLSSFDRVAIRDTISVIKSQGDTKLNVDDFPWKANVIESFESSRNDGIKMIGDDPKLLSATNVTSDFGHNVATTEFEFAKLENGNLYLNQNAEDEVISDNEFSHIETEAV